MAEDTLLQTKPKTESQGLPEDHWLNEVDFAGVEGAEEIKTSKTLAETPGLAHALKRFVDLDKLRGRSIALPKETDSETEKQNRMNDIYGKLGRPEKPEGYKLEPPEELPEGLQWSAEAADGFKKLAHQLGLNQSQLDGLIKFHTGMQIGQLEAAKSAKDKLDKEEQAVVLAAEKKALQNLEQEWGTEFVKRLEAAKKGYDVLTKDPEERIRFAYKYYLENLAEGNLLRGAAPLGEEVKVFSPAWYARQES